MIFGSSRKRRPSPIQVPKFEERQGNDRDDPSLRPKSPLLPTATNTARPTSLAPKFSFNRSVVPQESTRTISTFRTSATIVTQGESPTRTRFITITQSIESPKKKGIESPEPTQTVFISPPTQIVTVTVPAVVAVPTAETLPPPISQANGAILISLGALIPVIVLSVVGELSHEFNQPPINLCEAGVAIIFTVAVIIWKRRERTKDDKGLAEQK